MLLCHSWISFSFSAADTHTFSVMRIANAARRAGVDVRWRPFNVRAVMLENNVALRREPIKVPYIWRDIERRAAVHGLPYSGPPIWPTDPDLLANKVAVVASAQGWIETYAVRSFEDWFLNRQPLGGRAIASILGDLGKDADAVISEALTPETAFRMESETDVARANRVFGAPSFVVGDELFWGDDRLEEALLWATREHPQQCLATVTSASRMDDA